MTSKLAPSDLSPQQLDRRQRVLRAAQAAFVTPEASDSFLTNCHGELGGQPLDLAIMSDDGLSRVEKAIYSERHLRGAAS